MRIAVAAVIFFGLHAASLLAADEPACRAPGSTFTASFPSFSIQSSERIVGFEITVSGADVVASADFHTYVKHRMRCRELSRGGGAA